MYCTTKKVRIRITGLYSIGSTCYIYIQYIILCEQYTLINKNPSCDTKQGWAMVIRSFQKNVPLFAFFSVLLNITEQSLRSFPFFLKERNVLCFLFRSFKKKGTFFFRSFCLHKSYKPNLT